MKENNENEKEKPLPKRPFFLSILGTAYLVYAVFLTIVFLIAILRNVWITEVLTDYLPDISLTRMNVFVFSLAAMGLYILSGIGVIMMLRLKKAGFYLFLIATLLIILVPHLLGFGSWLATGIFIVVLLLFAIFLRKMQ